MVWPQILGVEVSPEHPQVFVFGCYRLKGLKEPHTHRPQHALEHTFHNALTPSISLFICSNFETRICALCSTNKVYVVPHEINMEKITHDDSVYVATPKQTSCQ